jgi:hypothetical protein
MPYAGIASNLRVRVNDDAGSSGGTQHSYTFIVCNNATCLYPNQVKCVVTNPSTPCSDTTHSLAFAAGERLVVQAYADSTSAGAVAAKWSLEYVPAKL